MKASELLADLIHMIAKHGDMFIVMDRVNESGTDVRSVYISAYDGTLHIEPVDH